MRKCVRWCWRLWSVAPTQTLCVRNNCIYSLQVQWCSVWIIAMLRDLRFFSCEAHTKQTTDILDAHIHFIQHINGVMAAISKSANISILWKNLDENLTAPTSTKDETKTKSVLKFIFHTVPIRLIAYCINAFE